MKSLRSRLTDTRLIDIASICLFSLVVSSCGVLAPYEAELSQGNFIRQEQFDQLQKGQNQGQVQFLLGTPLLTGEFTDTRWIYPTVENDQYVNLIIEFQDGEVKDFFYQ